MIIPVSLAASLAVIFAIAAPALGVENSPPPGGLALAPIVTEALAPPICRLDSPWPLAGWAWVCEV
jgi:hypothetical protein